MVNTAQSQPDYVQDRISDVKNSKHFSCRYVYNSSLHSTRCANEISVHRNMWKKWLHNSTISKPVVPSLTFEDVVKNNASASQKCKNSPLVAVQERSQQHEPPELVKEVSGKRQTTYLKGPGKSRLVKNPKNDVSSDGSVHCFNRFDPLADLEYDFYDTNEYINQPLVDASTFAAQGTWEDDHTDSLTRIDKNDKFDTLLVKKKVDQCIIPQVKVCADYQACKNQMEEPFGVIPLSPLLVYTGKNNDNKQVYDPLLPHKLVRQSGRPNFLGCRIPVDSNLNIKNWRFYLQDFWDKQLVDLLEYGVPLDFDRRAPLMSTEENHASAQNFDSHVQTYISQELKHGAMLGPFASKPIHLHISPFMTREKPDSEVRRTIVDLSWPESY